MAINNILKSIILDVYDHDKTPKSIKSIAADNDVRYIAAEIQSEGVRYDVSASSTVELIILRPDKVGVSITGQPQEFTYETDPVFDPDTGETTPGETVTYYGVYAELDQAALAKSGILLGQFKITNGEQVLHTEIFQVKNGIALDVETSEWADQYQGYNLDELVQSVNSVVATVTEMETDVSELKSGLNDMINSAYVTDSANGGVAHFEDGADNVPLKSLKVNIEPVQSGSGDPSPDNVRPISGWGSAKVMRSGKNLWNPSDVFTGFINNITNTIQANSVSKICYIRAKPNTTYTVSKMVGERFSVAFSDVEPAINAPLYGVILDYTGTSITITTENSTKYLLAWCYLGSADTATEAEMLASVQFELGSDATEYEPYNGVNVSIDLGRTVYGGTLDVVSGELTVNRAYITLQDYPIWNGLYITNNVKRLVSGDYLKDTTATMCDTLQAFKNQSGISSRTLNNISITTDGRFVITPSFIQSAATADEAKEILMAADPIHLVYTLATPTVYHLTPQEIKSLLGTNNIFADTGDTAVEYRADTKLYIKRLTDSDTDMIADANIVSGQYFMVGNDLYKATVNIASGAQIVVGTNATKVSLSEALNQIKEA